MINMQPDDVITFTVVVVCSEPVSCFDPLNVDISGTRYDIKKRSTAFILVFHALLHENYKNFPFISTNQ